MNAVLVLALVLGVGAFVRADKQVTLLVDGVPQTVRTYAGSVGGLLADEHLALTWRDVVAPSPDTPLSDGMEVAVRYSRPLDLHLDGQPVEYWTTALTVDEALNNLGMRIETASLSSSRSQRIPRQGLSVDVALPDLVVFKHDGRRTSLLTTARTVQGAMRDAGIHLGALDRTDAALRAPVRDGMVVTITRVDIRVVKDPYVIKHSVVRRTSNRLYEGDQRVLQHGRNGKGVARYQVTVEDGVVVRRVLTDRSVVRRPVAEVVELGSKTRTYAAPGTDIGGLNWTALAMCESSGNPLSVNPAGYYGLYQFDLGTWASVGGSGNPTDATPQEQTYRAQLLFASRGAAPWPVCGPLLFT